MTEKKYRVRNPGWYWVKVDDTADWQPLQWSLGHWHVPTSRGVEWWTNDQVAKVALPPIEEPQDIEEE